MTMASTCWSLLTASSSSPSKRMMTNKSLSAVAVAATITHQMASAMVTTNTTKTEMTNKNGNYLEQAHLLQSPIPNSTLCGEDEGSELMGT